MRTMTSLTAAVLLAMAALHSGPASAAAKTDCEKVALPIPLGLTEPIPVITTRRVKCSPCPCKFPNCARQVFRTDGAGDGDRTRDIQLGKLAFYR